MKTYSVYILSFILLLVAQTGFAQDKKTTFKVAGECGMCKKKIEGAAKTAGASYASWNTETKMLTVSYAAKKTNPETIQKAIAATGYDTPTAKATDEAYEKLHECCKYDRPEASKTMSCCDNGTCAKEGGCCKAGDCVKDGKCSKDMDCCKEGGCEKKDCCKKDEQ